MKKILVTMVVSLSLLGLVTTVSANDWVSESSFDSKKGTFIVSDASLEVFSRPDDSSEVVATYDPGETINYDQISQNGAWISYIGNSGNRRYVKIKTGHQSSDKLTVLVGTWESEDGSQVVEISEDGSYQDNSGDGYKIAGFSDGHFNVVYPGGAGWALYYLAVGENAAGSDATRERIVATTAGLSQASPKDFLYRVSDQSSARTKTASNSTKTFSNVTMKDVKGSFLIGNQSLKVYNSPDTTTPVVATYEPGEQFLFDQVGINKYSFWLSYVGASSGQRRYVPIPTPHDGAGYPAPPLGVMLSDHSTYHFGDNASGTFYPNKSIRVRTKPQMSAETVATYDSGESVRLDEVLISDGHYWMSYIGSSGNRRYLPIGKVTEQNLWGRFELDY